jgi:two-component system OmpR family response regulator
MKILIVDDNKDITKMLSKYMTIKGHSCHVANDGQSGLNLIENQKFDVILLDIAMPKFSGSDVIDELCKSGKIKNQNIVTLTASTLSGEVELTLKSKGVHSCLKKPIDPDVLLDHIQQFENKKTI